MGKLSLAPPNATADVFGLVTLGSPGGAAKLNEQGEIVGPIIGRMILESDTSTVPALGEQFIAVDSLSAPTRAFVGVGDGVTAGGRIVGPFRSVMVNGSNGGATPVFPVISVTGGSRASGSSADPGSFFDGLTLIRIRTGNGGQHNGSFTGGTGGGIGNEEYRSPILFDISPGNGASATATSNGRNARGLFQSAGAVFRFYGGNAGTSSNSLGGEGGAIRGSVSQGLFSFSAGNGGNGSTGSFWGGDGGQILVTFVTFRAGNGGNANANAAGGAGGNTTTAISCTAGNGAAGGPSTGDTGGNGGNTGGFTSNGGNGASGTGGVAGGNGGNGGSFTSNGGAASGTTAGGNGGSVNLSAAGTTAGANITFGTAAPEGSVTAPPGSLYLRNNAGTGEMWLKTSGTGNTGWTQK